MPLLPEEELRERVARLAALDRPSASEGERRGAELIAAELRGLTDRVRVDRERAHGTYWWPLGLLTAAAAVAGASGRRLLGAAVGAAAAAGVADDITGGSLWFRRALPQRETHNVIAEFGPADAPQTVVLVAHHDAAHSGLVFHPELPRAIGRRFPGALERADTTPPTMWAAFYGPLLVALGSALGRRGRVVRALGVALSAGNALAMADIGARSVVPGANDNLTGVAALLSVAHAFSQEPPAVRTLLVFTGAEESFMEGMQAFARRHFPSLPTSSTTFVCLDTVGSPRLLLLEGEGMLRIADYPEALKATVAACAEREDVELVRGLRFRNATDGLISMKAGYPTVMLGSVDEFKFPSNYHWPTDTAENVDYATVAAAARLSRALVLELARPGAGAAPHDRAATATVA